MQMRPIVVDYVERSTSELSRCDVLIFEGFTLYAFADPSTPGASLETLLLEKKAKPKSCIPAKSH